MNKFAFCLVLLSVFGAFTAEEFPIDGGISPITDETQLSGLTQKVKTHLAKVSTGENKAPLEFVRLHTATIQVVAGTKYELLAEIKENDGTVNCTISLLERPWMDFIRMNLACGEEKRKYQFTSGKDDQRKKRQTSFGGFSELSESSAQDLHPKLTAAFDHLRTEKPGFDLTFKRVVRGTYQVVAGFRYKVTVEATNTANELKTCEADILEKLKNEFVFDLNCDNQIHSWTKQF